MWRSALLSEIDILIFVHDELLQIAAPALPCGRVGFQQMDRQWHEVVEGQGVGSQSLVFELLIDERQVWRGVLTSPVRWYK